MSTFKARGLVIKEIPVGESDKILILLLKDIGKLSVSARGARKPKSKFLAGTQLFSYADFVIYDGGRFNSLCEANLIKSFYGICDDYNKLVCGNLILEVADKTVVGQMPGNDILYLILVSLLRLCKGGSDSLLIAAVFGLKYLQLNGYGAGVDCCVGCGAVVDFGTDCGTKSLENNCDQKASTNYLRNNVDHNKKTHFCANGIMCKNCVIKTGDRVTLISYDSIRAIQYILSSEIKDVYKFSASSGVADELLKASQIMMDSHFDAKIKSRDMFI